MFFTKKNKKEVNRQIEGVRLELVSEAESLRKYLKSELDKFSEFFSAEVNQKKAEMVEEASKVMTKAAVSLSEKLAGILQSIEIIKKNDEVTDRKILDDAVKHKNYIDGVINTLRSEINRSIDTRVVGLLSEKQKDLLSLQTRVDSVISNLNGVIDSRIAQVNREAAESKEKALALKAVLDIANTKISFFDRDINELKNSNREVSSAVSNFKELEKKVLGDLEHIKAANALQIETAVDKKTSDYQFFINQQFFDSFVKLVNLNKEMLSKYVPTEDKDNKMLKLQREVERTALEEKWNKEKDLQGKKILNKGVAILEERTRLHNEILTLEKQGVNVTGKKERLLAFDWILASINGGVK